MQYPSLFNNLHTIITKTEIDIDFSNEFVKFSGENKEVLFNIHNYELENDCLFSGHIIVNNDKLFKEVSFSYFKRLSLTADTVYVLDVTHDGEYQKCSINDELIVCSSWVLPIVFNNTRTDNSLYGDIISHRINIKTFKLPKLL